MGRLTPDQAAKLIEAVGQATGYLWRLVDRLVKVGLDTRGPNLMKLVTAACGAMHSLTVELHYQRCGHGVGRRPMDTARPS